MAGMRECVNEENGCNFILEFNILKNKENVLIL